MKGKLKQILRWLTIAICSGVGGYLLVTSLWSIVTHFNYDWFFTIAMVALTLLFSGIPLAAAYFTFRRHYQELVSLAAMIGAIVVCGLCFSLPYYFGVLQFLKLPPDHNWSWLAILGLPVSFLLMLGPFYIADWFYRACLRISDRYFKWSAPDSKWTSK